MCGIAGLVSNKPLNINFSKFLDCINHRGPDNTGIIYWKEGQVPTIIDEGSYNVALGHKRLSILDLSNSGSQPFSSNDKRWWITYNGEVYNYVELKTELIGLGYIFHTQTDTEVVLLSILHWGIDAALKRFQGMFAFALFDSYTGDITLARDAFGIKPLYFSYLPNGIVFSSEIKLLLKFTEVDKVLNPPYVAHYLLNGGCDFGEETLLKNINQLPPGSWQTFNFNFIPRLTFNRFWSPYNISRRDISFKDAVVGVRELFLKSIKMHLRSDVPFGVALSGGLDSSAIVCCIRYLDPEIKINTFSFVASDENLSEENFVDIINKHVKAEAHKIYIKDEDIHVDIDNLMKYQDEPFGGLSIYSQFRVFKEAKAKGIVVMLDGQGADELMGGYAPLQGARLASIIRSGKLFSAIRFLKIQKEWKDRTPKSVFFTAINQLLSSKIFEYPRRLVRKSKRFNWLNKHWFESNNIIISNNDYLCKGPEYLRDILKKSVSIGLPSLLRFEDRNSMAHSIESRVPFLTIEFAEFLLSLPEEYLIDEKGVSKAVFREAMRGIVPDAILDRREKKGFATPDFKWLSNYKKSIISSLKNSKSIPCLNLNEAVAAISVAFENERNFSPVHWRLINFIKWTNSLKK
jgi:asparagine synthase (glutamine-hydrolysing)